jgi:hypothetical protein
VSVRSTAFAVKTWSSITRAPCRKVIALPAVSLSLVPKWHVTIIWSALLRPSGW